ncbi:MAG: phosphopantothenate/pantothenate synthetase [Methanophagales archaeon]|nr:phosphopantothenate/pantothenate synthetase [Methanophagales archaeon]
MQNNNISTITIPKTHPRYRSLLKREKIVAGIRAGITSERGLIAHGRGEAFDYLIDEQTLPAAMIATEVASALLLTADKPVISVNGNVAALVPEEVIALSELLNAPLEVNLFYWSETRVMKIREHLERHGATITNVLGDKADARIRGLGIEHARARVANDGIYTADVVLAPLEDGDRCEALIAMGKTVITIDLNPFSRTSKYATVSIVDDIERAIKNLISIVEDKKKKKKDGWMEEVAKSKNYDNAENLKEVIREIVARLVIRSSPLS